MTYEQLGFAALAVLALLGLLTLWSYALREMDDVARRVALMLVAGALAALLLQ